MANVFDVAKFFIILANQRADDLMTNLKLNKMLYFAQGAYLARTGSLLFEDEIEAWQLGPVIPSVYRRYKVCGSNPIHEDKAEFSFSVLTDEERETLYDVVREFGKYTGATLVNITHKGNTPWRKTIDSNLKVIDNKLIYDFFVEHPVPMFSDVIDVPTVEVLPAEWYDPREDEEWEEYLKS